MPTGGMEATTTDHFLGGRLVIAQPVRGYRAGSDPLFLAAAVTAQAGETALDLGCGVGTAALALLARAAGVRATGLELQPELAALARRNAEANGLADRFRVVEGCLGTPPPELKGAAFHHVLTNPPWYEPGSVQDPEADSKRIGHVEGEVDLAAWLAAALRRVRPRGHLWVVHRADRLGDILAALAPLRVGGVRVFPLWPKAGQPATRVVVAARKDVRTPLEVLPGLVLHHADGSYTAGAESVLRGASPLW
ncbi:tRNA1(Val) (adenine(37)-N6)-methyltransferase [Magnetospirillum sp. UT-4]|uniref:tRNA1(Val) (adenine(37)-N6)-methyltransferase n=1 Tax=Magnetospirillum sp. UT-4 TaxID=2681467 RepID=UPI00137CE3D5|nr:methyltransferase [Magnetospirillum sp. UT-4]CAA7620548.1 conserved hypothetical protein [Magnetospirillum sp. UT-4]